MQELIRIEKREIGTQEVNSVNARELHESLGVKKDFSSWIKSKLKDGMLDEDIDYVKVTQKGELSKTGQWRDEYILTLDTAKHLAMMSRTSKGKEVRNYFIEIEKQFTVKTGTSQDYKYRELYLTQLEDNNHLLLENNQLLKEKLNGVIVKKELIEDDYNKANDRPWTPEEEMLVMAYKSQGKTNDYIADMLNRSNPSIRAKSCRLRSSYIASLINKDMALAVLELNAMGKV